MALPLLLLRAASSSVVKSAAKNVAKKTIKNKAKDFIRGKGKKKSSARMGENKSNTNVRSSTSLVPIRKLDQTSNDLDSSTTEISKTNSTSNFGGIENQLNSIVNLTSSLNSLVLEQYNKKNKSSQREKLQREKLKKRKREESQEKKIPGSGIAKGITSKAKEFNILGAIFNFLLGAGLLRLIDLLKGGVDESGKPVGPLKSLSDGLRSFQNLFYGFKLAKGAIGSLVSALGSAFKAIPNVLKSFVGVATKGISNLGRTVSNGFKGLLGSNGRIVKYFKGLISKGARAASFASRLSGIDTRSDEVKNARNALNNARRLERLGGSLDSTRFMRGGGGRSTLSTATPGFTDSSRYRAPGQARASGFQLEQARKVLGSTPAPSKAGRLSGGIGGSSLTSRGLKNAPGRLATRVIGRGGRESLRGISKIVGPTFKFGGRALSRIPIMGPLIVLAANLLDDDVTPTEAIYRSLGSMAGGAIGAALVGGATVGFGAILGGIAGQIIGEYFGELLYIGVNGGGFGEVGKRIQNDISHALTKGAEYAGMVKDWAGKGFGRLYEGLPKIGPIPNWAPFGLGGKEIPTPIFPLLLASAIANIPKAFFSDESMKDGEVKKPKEETSRNIKIGQKAILNGKPVFWAGDDYGWQSRESFEKLKKSGKTESHESGGGGDGTIASNTFDVIGSGEGDYNSVNRGNAGDTPGGAKSIFGKNITDMTVDEVYAAQRAGKVFAVGKYQIIDITMPGFVEYLKRQNVNTSTTKFNAATQEKFKLYVINEKRPEIGRYLRGESDDLIGAAQGAAREFASVGVSRPEQVPGFAPADVGDTLYGGRGNNAAIISPQEIQDALRRDRQLITQPDSGGSPNRINPIKSPTSLNNEILEQYTEYENDMGGVNFIPVPIGGGEQANMMIGGGESGMMMVAGSSPESMVNNWWKSQFLGFLYKQG